MTHPALIFSVALAALALGGCDNSVERDIPDPTATPEGWSLVWADEFDGDALDESKWSLQIGDGCPNLCGFGNNELQIYTADNHEVSDGTLKITARRSVTGDDTTYTSTRMNTQGKAAWTYGRFEARIKLPVGQGIWPAFWMFFEEDTYGGWAASGEIDIMEYLGNEPDVAFGTLHYGGPAPNNTFSGKDLRLSSGTFADDFFVFTAEWEEGEIRWYINNVLYQTQTSNDWYTTGSDDPAAPFDHDFFLLLNMAVGGNLPGPPNASTPFPQTMEVDYVRVYKRSE